MDTSKIPSIISRTPTKFTEQESAELETIRVRYQDNVLAFGQLYVQELDLDILKKSLVEEKKSIELAEKAFLSKIVDKYGEGTFDPKTGVFTPKS